jgi:hypothetical protein
MEEVREDRDKDDQAIKEFVIAKVGRPRTRFKIKIRKDFVGYGLYEQEMTTKCHRYPIRSPFQGFLLLSYMVRIKTLSDYQYWLSHPILRENYKNPLTVYKDSFIREYYETIHELLLESIKERTIISRM